MKKTVMELVPVKSEDIASKITKLHLEVLNHLRMSVEKAIQIGELLTQQKSRLKHGEWLPWIKEKLPFSQPTAFNYMNLYQNPDKLLNVNNLAEAYKLLRTSKQKLIDHKKMSLLDACNNLKNAFLNFKDDGICEEKYYFYFTGEKLIALEHFYVSVPFKTHFEKVAVNGYDFNKVLLLAKEEPVLEIEKDHLKITSKSIRATLNARSGKGFETLYKNLSKDLPSKMIDEKRWKPIPNNFIEGAMTCHATVGHGTDLGFLYVNDDVLISTDDFRISRYKMEGLMGRFCISRTALENLLKFESNFKLYQINDDWFFFKDEFDMVFGFPIDLKKVLKDGSEYFVFEIIEDLDLPRIPTREIDALRFFCEGEFDIDRYIEFYLYDNKLILKGKGRKGLVEREYPIKYEGKEIHFVIRPDFLSDAMPYSLRCKIGEDQVLFTSDSYEYLVSIFPKKK